MLAHSCAAGGVVQLQMDILSNTFTVQMDGLGSEGGNEQLVPMAEDFRAFESTVDEIYRLHIIGKPLKPSTLAVPLDQIDEEQTLDDGGCTQTLRHERAGGIGELIDLDQSFCFPNGDSMGDEVPSLQLSDSAAVDMSLSSFWHSANNSANDATAGSELQLSQDDASASTSTPTPFAGVNPVNTDAWMVAEDDEGCAECGQRIIIHENGNEVDGDVVMFGCGCGSTTAVVKIEPTSGHKWYSVACSDWVNHEDNCDGDDANMAPPALSSTSIPDAILNSKENGLPDDFCGDCEIKVVVDLTGNETDGDLVDFYCGCGAGEVQVGIDPSTGEIVYHCVDWLQWPNTESEQEGIFSEVEENTTDSYDSNDLSDNGEVPQVASAEMESDEGPFQSDCDDVEMKTRVSPSGKVAPASSPGGNEPVETEPSRASTGIKCNSCKWIVELSGSLAGSGAVVIFCGCGVGSVKMNEFNQMIPGSMTDWETWTDYHAKRNADSALPDWHGAVSEAHP